MVKMKAYDSPSIAILSVALILIMVMAIAALFGINVYQLSKGSASKQLDIYLLNNGMKAARMYTEQSLNYSVIQAMYDNGKNGCHPVGSNNTAWTPESPSAEDIIDNLEVSLENKLAQYTSGRFLFLGRHIEIPTFSRNEMLLTREGDLLKVSVQSSKKIRYVETEEEELGISKVELRAKADMFKSFETEYFALYEAGREVFGKVEGKNCKDMETGNKVLEEDFSGFAAVAEVTEKTDDPCYAKAKVTVTGNQPVPVYDDGVKFVPLHIVYYIDIE
ncbi:MAG: hypothetical protein JW754_05135 [Candidatus Aenigmarchaeota archaeon]|nr:hypothetical protein [Candidatus Aenigmarchaeota archaeon]